MGAKTAFGFMIGAVASFMAGYIGMRVSVLANVRTAEAAKKGMSAGLSMAFKGGSVTGMIVAGLALTSVAGYYTATHDVIALVALGFGGSLISISPVWAVVSSPRAPTWAPTWWVRSKRYSRRRSQKPRHHRRQRWRQRG